MYSVNSQFLIKIFLLFLAIDATAYAKENKNVEPIKTKFGRLLGNTIVQFEKAEGSSVNLTGKAKG